MLNKILDLYLHVFHKSFDYDQIDEYVFIGTNMCCQYGFDKELLGKNVRADISLEETKVDAPTGVGYFLWLSTKDHEAPSPEQLALGVLTLDFLIKKKVRIFIHCTKGHGRAPTLYAAYLVSKGMKVDEALAQIKTKRPAIHLEGSQHEALVEFAKHYPQKRNS